MDTKYNFERIKVLITSACNSNCTHCFRNKEKNSDFLTESKLKEIVDFGLKNNCNYFSFSGGEFFTHPFAYGLIEYCLAKKTYVSILTNGLDLNIDFFAKIQEKKLISFQISIDGLQESHDQRRGEGAFKRTISNVKKLYSLGYKLSAKTVLDEYNYKDFIDVLKMPWFDRFLVLPVASNRDDCLISKETLQEYEKVMTLIYKSQIIHDTSKYQCNCYPKELAIKYDGGVYPCTEAREHNEFMIGNITNRTLEDVLLEYDKKEDKLQCQSIQVEECGSCDSKDVCRGGCRLRALRYHGKINAIDPFICRLFNNRYLDVPIGKLFWGENNSN